MQSRIAFPGARCGKRRLGTQNSAANLRSRAVPAAASSPEQSRGKVLMLHARQLYEDAWSQGRVLLLNQIMAEDHAQVDRVWQQTAGVGRRRMKRGILAYRAAYPDIRFVVEDISLVEGADKVFVHWTASGTNTGPIREQPPTGRRVEFAGISLLSFNADGQIQQSMVFRQAPDDEKQYFIAQATQRDSQVGAAAVFGGAAMAE